MESILFIRIKELCEKRDITLMELCNTLGLSQSLIRKWKSTASPSVEKIRRVAEYFDVSVDYLIGLSDIPDQAEKIIEDADFISLQRARSKMSDQDKERMMKMLKVAFDTAFSEEE